MSTFLLKFILCSGLLYGTYHLILRKEKTLHFNRFFLLSILGLSLWFPTLITKTEYIEIPVQQELTYIEEGQYTPQVIEPTVLKSVSAPKLTISTNDALWCLYGLVSLFFLVRFCRNLWQINRLRKEGTLIEHQGLSFCLRSDIHASFTFLNTIYANQDQFESGELPQDIITHESIHTQQKHSIDIILMELMQCFLWFNPLLYLIKSAIKLNHEYLADERVCAQTQQISAYQKTLIQAIYHSKQQPVLASQLTYGQTKNRLHMMVNKIHKPKALAKLVLTLGIVSAALWTFGQTKVQAQEAQSQIDSTEKSSNVEEKNHQNDRVHQFISSPLSNQKVKFVLADGQMKEAYFDELSLEEKQRFEQNEAKAELYIEPIKVKEPSSQELRDFLDKEKYGIWIDNQRIDNELINNYTSDDFHHFYVSKLYANAKNYGKHEYQVDLTTKAQYQQEPYANGGWKSWSSIKKSRMNYRSMGQDRDLPPPPPPPLIKINDNTQVRFQYANGDEVFSRFGQLNERQLKIFKSPEGEGMIFLPPPPPATISQEMLQQYADPKYSVTIDHNEINARDLLNYKPEDFYLYFKKLEILPNGQRSKVTGINFLTKKNYDTSGKWIPFSKDFLPVEQKNTPSPNTESGNKGGSIANPSYKDFDITVTGIEGNVVSLSCEGCAWSSMSFGASFTNDFTIDYYGSTFSSRYKLRDSPFAFSIKKGRTKLEFESIKGTTWKQLSHSIEPFKQALLTPEGIEQLPLSDEDNKVKEHKDNNEN